MSDASLTADAPVDDHADHGDDDHGHGHASDFLYIKIALGLAFITALEVAWPYTLDAITDDTGIVLMAPLLIMMAIKFVIIAAFFMHLKFDSPLLSRIFYFGLLLAVGVYLIALVTFDVFRGW